MSDYTRTVFIFFADKNQEAIKLDKDEVVRTINGGTKRAGELVKGETILLAGPVRPAIIESVVKGAEDKPLTQAERVTARHHADPTFKGMERLLRDPDLMVFSVMNDPAFRPRKK